MTATAAGGMHPTGMHSYLSEEVTWLSLLSNNLALLLQSAGNRDV